MDIKSFFTEIQQKSIQLAIENAELHTSGEIRVHIESKCKDDVFKVATKVFEKLGMHNTEQRNGVLFYLAVEDKKFAILGDKGINEVVPTDFWNIIRDLMTEEFKKEQFTVGLCQGIEMAGEHLKTHFPYQKDDKNELTNEISFED
jgi:uncharacterized membrane protein